eukprot:CAMPEP_0177556948 /NCGR_PEP_ID=MMETSP0369-20130122/69367_1 /TAXON_ID=447022 ORGANISM="Scrippsiella hangoei-like, Strain SHHI-4" /NCGR_SAMPLE_ID=MMETSP0369 /ASSEMBLY_ACC=CAM_ASM_000364 /LENGTH=73 /DNA_ID=CAMNT_0019043229 /DNA_START=138 /DNA_END=360 /DNA_ORIENTATION=+
MRNNGDHADQVALLRVLHLTLFVHVHRHRTVVQDAREDVDSGRATDGAHKTNDDRSVINKDSDSRDQHQHDSA